MSFIKDNTIKAFQKIKAPKTPDIRETLGSIKRRFRRTKPSFLNRGTHLKAFGKDKIKAFSKDEHMKAF